MTNDQVFAAIAPENGILMYAERRADLATAIADYGRILGASPQEAAAGVKWYQLPADTKIDHWEGYGDAEQWAEWDAAEPSQFNDQEIEDAIAEVAR